MANHEHKNHESHHHIIPNRVIFITGGVLLALTVLTVWVAQIDLGALNFPIAMLVATIKGLCVALIFMNLLHDKRENGVIFATSFLFAAIFMVFTATDLFFRGDVYVKAGALEAAAGGKSTLQNPWISTPELVAKGKGIFSQQCVSCHGAEGKGNGPAASALNPPPRNFTADADWKNGRKVSGVFKTLKNGVPGSAMASYATLPVDDRWALVQYVLSLGPTPPPVETVADLTKAGISTSGVEAVEKVIPVAIAMERMAQADPKTHSYEGHLNAGAQDAANPGAQVYAARCLDCHGARGEGGIRVKNMGVNPEAFVTTQALGSYSSMGSVDAFTRAVVRGLPGNIMPGNGQLSGAELRELYQYTRGLPGAH